MFLGSSRDSGLIGEVALIPPCQARSAQGSRGSSVFLLLHDRGGLAGLWLQ